MLLPAKTVGGAGIEKFVVNWRIKTFGEKEMWKNGLDNITERGLETTMIFFVVYIIFHIFW